MADFMDARERYRTARRTTAATHKFAVGALVMHKDGVRSEKASFRITRQLPDSGQGLQYRIRSDRDGLERVTIESSLERPAQD